MVGQMDGDQINTPPKLRPTGIDAVPFQMVYSGVRKGFKRCPSGEFPSVMPQKAERL
jgi:hypothetical protein